MPAPIVAIAEALDALATDDVHVPGAELGGRLVELHQLANRIHAEILRTTAAFDTSGEWDADGAASAAAWMRGRLRITPGVARGQVSQARTLRDHLPLTAAALADGSINTGHLRVLTDTCTANAARREALPETEHILVGAAAQLDPYALRNVAMHWAHSVDARGTAAEVLDVHEGRYLCASPTFDGVVAIDGTLDPEGGAIVITTLDAVGNLIREPQDRRSARQRRADALVELCRMALAHGELLGLPDVGGQRPQVTLTIPEAVALGFVSGGAELTRAGAIGADAAMRFLCDASVLPMIINEAGQPLDVGRTQRTVPAHLRRAVVQRDTHCVFAGCDRPSIWCEVHHIVHWAHGGPTSLDNLVLICSQHHHAIHDRGFKLHGRPGNDLHTVRPDGRTVEAARPPNFRPFAIT